MIETIYNASTGETSHREIEGWEDIPFEDIEPEPSEMEILQAKIAELTETINILIDNEE